MEQGVCDWLREYLRDAPREVGEVRTAAKAAGYTRSQLREAKRTLGVRTTNNWEKDRQETSRWFWQLPEEQAAPPGWRKNGWGGLEQAAPENEKMLV